MINLIKKGIYKLGDTKDNKLMLRLGSQAYSIVNAKGIGQIISFSKHRHLENSLFAEGEYRLYLVEDEPDFVDLMHLELAVGDGKWQGYLLLTGLPTANKVRSRIIPTREVISNESSLEATSCLALMKNI